MGVDVTHSKICILFTVSTDVSSEENNNQISLYNNKISTVYDIKFNDLFKNFIWTWNVDSKGSIKLDIFNNFERKRKFIDEEY